MKIKKKINKDTINLSTDNLSPLEKARIVMKQRRQEALENGEEIKRRTPLELWEENKTSLRKSINAKCFECNGGEFARNRTRFCIVFTCPLWHVRPHSSGVTKKDCLEYKED